LKIVDRLIKNSRQLVDWSKMKKIVGSHYFSTDSQNFSGLFCH